MSTIAALRAVETALGLAWAIFGRSRDIRINGVPVPAFLQATLRFVAPSAFLAILLLTAQGTSAREG